MAETGEPLRLKFTPLAGSADADELFVVGPSLGTSVSALWGRCAAFLGHRFEVVGWDLPGHGNSRPATAPFSVAQLADAVRAKSTELAAGRHAYYAGVSLGGAVGFDLAMGVSSFAGVAAVSSAPRIGQPSAWRERAELVRGAGTGVMRAGSAERWFATGFVERHPEVAGALLDSLSETDALSYAFACEALADFDLSERVAGVRVPVLLMPGEHDGVVPPSDAPAIATSMAGAHVQVVAGAAHLPPAENPRGVADLLGAFADRVRTDRHPPGSRPTEEAAR